ncbi:hypothetical protein WA026_013486 [Henosepilachna vigintioctopunctata]|uniref:Aprataxin and PNK-like factor n=1 Tax=Henosepilachna vigintioctopunctata TaxID=420089 RepID=A0AAW1V784_9CUCU
MVSLNIFDVDSQNNDVPLLTLQSGEHILGRGSFSNCTDKRISRNHIVIKVEDGRATLKSVHVNPCYFMSFNQSNVQLLSKNLPVELKDGDKFAFLTDIWYRIKINKSDSFVNTPASRTLTIPKDSSATLVTSSSHTRIFSATSGTTSFVKRSLEEIDSNEGRKKLKTINESLDQFLQDLNEIKTPDCVDKSNTEIKKEDGGADDSGETTREVFRKIEIPDSDEDSDVDLTLEVTRDIATVTTIQASKSEVKEKVSSDSDDDENIQTIDEPDSSNIQENFNEDLPVPSSELEKSNDKTSESAVKIEQSVSNSDDMGPEDNEAARKEERGDAVDSSSSVSGNSIGNKLRREQCWYGSRCYRKNPRHREELSHPGDEDYNPDPNGDRPECSYGATCYRSNQMHRRQYRHPSSGPAPKPSKNGSIQIINYIGCRYCKHCTTKCDHDDSAKGGGSGYGGVV